MMIRETKKPRQSSGQYTTELLPRYNRIADKLSEMMETIEVQGRMQFLSMVLKIQLAKELGKKEGMPKDRSFVECAQDLIETSAREVEARIEVEEPGWTRIEYQRPRNMPNPWRRREHRDVRREKNNNQESRASQVRPRFNDRREDRKCYGWGKVGHLVAHCPRTRCFECGAEGHIARQCPYMYRRKEQSQPEPMEINLVPINSHLGEIMCMIEHEGYSITALQMFYIDNVNAEEFFEVYRGVLQEYPEMVSELISGACLAMEITGMGEKTPKYFRNLVGPSDPEMARQLRPNTLRAIFGENKIKNAMHVTDLPEDSILEVEYFFKILI
nr:uncharacterized protein LOC112211079 [Halyomorpha halys]